VNAANNEKFLRPIETIELLSVDLLNRQRPLVNQLRSLAADLRLEFGWHYLLDLTWIIERLGAVKGKRILDAGAGTGILQWYLADQGAEVISVDRLSRATLPLRFRRRFNVTGLRPEDLQPASETFWKGFNRPAHGPLPRRWASRLAAQARDLAGYWLASASDGKVLVYNQDLTALPDLPGNSVDAIVSVSALEHNTPEGLGQVTPELMRVLKPDGKLLATLTAGRDKDWWHEPSSGWCYTDTTLKRLFDLPADTPANYDRYDELFAALRGCTELRDNLAAFYFQDGCKGMPAGNGMPGGRWDPQYQPVGVCKIKN
jgi:SAM-dependent methyltransferase